MVEIIYPENRIIVDYGSKEDLVLLGAFDKDGNDINMLDKDNVFPFPVAPVTNKYESIDEVIEMQSRLGKMEEGFVVKFADGYRCKFKSAEYLKVARLLSEMTPLNFWKAMKNGIVQQEILEEIPEEFEEEVERIKSNLENRYKEIDCEMKLDFIHAIKCIGGLGDIDDVRRDLGIFIKKNSSELTHPSAMFPILLKKGIDRYIMKTIRPVGNKILT